MQTGEPSRTALAAATHRAAHQLMEQGSLFNDPLAVRILDVPAEAIVRDAEANPAYRRMRLFIAARTRFAEDALAASAAKGVTQLVVLGAGLDTFAYRNPYARLQVFEVDHPATQAWKRQRLAAAGIDVPGTLSYAPVDFERKTLESGLVGVGFDAEQPTFFTWLGVVPYLTPAATWETLRYIAGLAGSAEVVFDYSDPPETLSSEMREYHDARAARVAALGEAWINFFSTETLHPELRQLGFETIEDLGPPQISERFFPHRRTVAESRGGHILWASTS